METNKLIINKYSKKSISQYLEKEKYPKNLVEGYSNHDLQSNIFKNIYSNSQIKTLWKIANSNSEIFNRLMTLLTKRISSYDNIIHILNKHNSDSNIYKKLKNLLYKKHSSHGKQRFNFKITSYMNILLSYVKTNKITIESYLDIGCGNQKTTYNIGKNLGLDQKNIHGVDFENFAETKYNPNKNKINFKLLTKNYTKLPYKTNSMSLISMFNVLHHVDDHHKMMKEITRILKPNGLLMIIEPDVMDFVDFMIVDVEHLLYLFVYSNENYNNIKNIDGIVNNYYSKITLDMFCDNYKLNNKYSSYLSDTPKFNLKYNREFCTLYQFT
jgi:ubiquinone/menaquinone biosynthesis C-methylase UbiE